MFDRIKSFFNISRREFRGMIVVFTLFVFIYSAPYFYEYLTAEPINFRIETLQADIEEINKFDYKKENYKHQEEEEIISLVSEKNLFEFNPNNLPLEDWIKLGLTEKQAAIIKKYEAKGGKFYKKEDLKKIYSISSKQYESLEPYINIPQHNTYQKKTYEKAKVEFTLVDINSVDSFSIQLIKGVGPAFASRIIKYRDRLGGFVSKEQLKEVFGIDSIKFREIVPQIVVDSSKISFIYINSVTADEFKKFPYLSSRQKNVLLAYRKHHGSYDNLSQLQKAALLSSETIEKIASYIKF